MSAHVSTDQSMVRTMSLVMGALVVFTLTIMALARIVTSGGEEDADPLTAQARAERLQPVGQVRTSLDDIQTDAAAAAETVAAAPKSGEELVNGACASCHLAGVAGAPKLDDAEAWATRREAGLDALVASVVNGKGAMPARGASTYTDEELLLAVKHIAGFGDDGAEAAAPAADDAAQAPADAAPAAEAAPAETAVADAAPAAGGELTDNIRSTVDGLCAGCHLAGVAGAPKIGDKAAWDERAAAGLEAMTQAVINGKGAMPPRAGSTLTDAEIPVAIEYLMSK